MTRGALRAMPVNATGAIRVLARLDGRIRNEPVSPDLASLPFESALTIRQFFAWQGKRNYEGLWWSSTTRSHVAFESLLEREFLMAADFDRTVTALSSQPFALLWPRGSSAGRSHVPDYFARLNSGNGRVIDVRSARHVSGSQAQFDATRTVCDQVGWEYEVFTGVQGQRLSNLQWLAGYRADRFRPEDDAAPLILDAFSPAAGLSVGVRRAARLTGLSADVVRAHVLHMLFDGLLRVDMDAPLEAESEVSS